MIAPLYWRGLFAFAAMPGMVAFLLPLAWLSSHGGLSAPRFPPGFALAAAGSAGVAWCCLEFHRRGKGTLAPWDPPRRLVTSGLYRFSRNPMYACVLGVLAGWALAYADLALGLYAACIAIAFQLRVVFFEERFLDGAFGEEWRVYMASTPRWI